jgi:hypothetical protein
MKRREFIGIAAAGAAGVVLPTPSRAEATRASTLARPRLLGILHDERMVAEIGRRYRETVPSEDNVDVLTRAILGAPAPDLHASIGRATEISAMRLRIDEWVQRDFNEGRTVTLHGWIVSLTEARQCALFSLLTVA